MIDIFVDIVQRVTPARYYCKPCHFETRWRPSRAAASENGLMKLDRRDAFRHGARGAGCLMAGLEKKLLERVGHQTIVFAIVTSSTIFLRARPDQVELKQGIEATKCWVGSEST
jgi:hypothetical protein